MKLSIYKYIIIEAETRPMEMLLGLFSITWGAWLGVGIIPPQPLHEIAKGDSILGAFNIGAGAFQAFSVAFRYPRVSRYAAIIQSIQWSVTGYYILKMNPILFFGYMALLLALANLWVVLHRAAVAKE